MTLNHYQWSNERDPSKKTSTLGKYEVVALSYIFAKGQVLVIMPLFVCKKLEVGELKPTTISLQLVERSVKYPVDTLEDVTIKVGKFFIPVVFVALEMDEDSQIPILLGRPFLVSKCHN
ncbi:hypothetical protein L6164_002580 [Bauhinia variegata]|uniref:Uncharacterized protein n=1 Tax=Bauhinia variegata TaxID=167791 RepID=A0ACB9PYN8_BAUVA|nr:hypothetical protein L6164_002580 [Bauhinia variegata]